MTYSVRLVRDDHKKYIQRWCIFAGDQMLTRHASAGFESQEKAQAWIDSHLEWLNKNVKS